ncbi:class II fructose-bisphosphate aldolase [Candidatus Shapirobacteria bacterium]|nr:class II fructose-bisphosphate aldolase [Candidatus Shapirobacteria bacterium]
MTPLKELLLNYKSIHSALPSFNIDTFEIFQAVEAAVRDTSLPCLVQLSAGEDKFIQAERLMMLVRKANADGVPIYLNMDHCQNLDRLLETVKLGFDMVHFDGSKLPYSENLSKSIDFVAEAKKINPNIIIEVEFNHINLTTEGVAQDNYTKVDEAVEFMTATNADLFAVSIGNLHGVNKSAPEKIDLERLSEIASALPTKMFTLHGGSGIPLEDVKMAVKLGIVKININTDLRLQFKQSLTASLISQNTEKMYDYFIPVISDVQKVVIEKLKNFHHQ